MKKPLSLLAIPVFGLVLAAACGDNGNATIDNSTGGTGTAGNTGSTAGSDGGTSGTDGGTSGNIGGNGNGNGNGSGTAGDGGNGGNGGDGGSDCSACPTGFSCGSGTVCKTASGIPAFGQVYVVVLENEDSTLIVGASSADYINHTLLGKGTLATGYKAVTHPSLPNYIAMTSGDTQGIACDCHPGNEGTACTGATCNLVSASPSCDCNKTADNLGSSLTTKNLMWRSYAEGMGTACNKVDSGNYAAKHVPFLYYDNVTSTNCADHIVDFSSFANDAGKYAFSFLTPDLCHDGHNTCAPENDQVKQADDWLKANVDTILNAPGFSKNGVLFVVYDEGSNYIGGTNNGVFMEVISPFTKAGGTVATAYDHYSLLATIEDGLGLPRVGTSTTKAATPMADVFK